jgi:peptide/nickel transport system substrate-binding protein
MLEEDQTGMSRTSKWLPLLALLAIVAIVFAACGGAASPSPSSAAPTGGASQPPAASEEPFEAISYPETGEAPCGQEGYTGNFKKISAPDRYTVVFDLCGPDVAFLSKIAFSSFAINDAGWLEEKIDPEGSTNQAIVSEPNGTGPFKFVAWNRGSDVTMQANPDYWGETKPSYETLIIRWQTEAAQRLVDLQSRTVDGIDNVGPTDFTTIQDNPELQLQPRVGLNTFYIGFNNNPKVEGFDNSTNPFAKEEVRQAIAKGIDRQRIVDNYYPEGSEVATHFTPCSIPNACEGEPWYEFDAAAAKQELTDAGFDFSRTYKLSYRAAVRGYLPDPPVVATEIQTQLKNNLGINVELDLQEDGAYIDNADGGLLPDIHLLGWGADYPDMTNFLDYHFGAGASDQFGDKFDDLTAVLQQGAAGANDEERRPFYEQANNLIREHVPMIPVAHGASGVAYLADVEGAHASPLSNEQFSVMTPGDREQLVFVQNGEPKGLYCADESDGEALRICEQMIEGLYGYAVAGVEAEPVLAESCEPNDDLTQWTCTLRQGVTFHNGATFGAEDVVLSYAVQWDAAHPLHKARDNSFTYFSGLFGGFLNPPAE